MAVRVLMLARMAIGRHLSCNFFFGGGGHHAAALGFDVRVDVAETGRGGLPLPKDLPNCPRIFCLKTMCIARSGSSRACHHPIRELRRVGQGIAVWD